jgi:tRNA(Ile)-lysidine synthase
MTKTTDQKALKFIDENNLIQKSDKILVAFSGGADSVFLLHFLSKFRKRFGIEVAAFHLNHKLRGKSADADEKFCIQFCSKHKIELVHISNDVKTLSKKMKLSIEETAREIRYSELKNASHKLKCNKIATAHNASDNVETILLNFIKGAGLKGLSGIPVKRENIIRPILCLSSEEIREYLRQNNISFRIDKTNLDSDYERNFLRNEIIPKLKERLNPRLEEKISNTAKIIYEVNSFVKSRIKKLESKSSKFFGDEIRVDTKALSKIDKSLSGIFLKSLIENKFDIELSSENIYSLIELLDLQTGRTVNLKKNILAAKERNKIVIRQKNLQKREKSVYKIEAGQRLNIGESVISINEINRKMIKFTSDKSIEFISGDGLGKTFEIRKWKDGDKFQPIGMQGTKKISDFLSDEKIPSYRKREHLVLTNSGIIIWVIGLRIDERFKVTKEVKKILKLTINNK